MYREYEQRDESAIESILDEAAGNMPEPELVSLSGNVEEIIDKFGSKVPDIATDPEGPGMLTTPTPVSRIIDRQRFSFGFRKRVDAGGTDGSKAAGVLEFFASGANGEIIICATLDEKELRVQRFGEDTRVNDPADVAYMKSVADETRFELERQVQDRQERERRAHERQLQQQEQAAAERHELARRTLLKGFVGLGTLAVLSAAGYGIKSVDWGELFKSWIDKFDDHKYTLEGGAVAEVGETVAPAFSLELANRPELALTEVPRLTNVSHGKTSYPDDTLSNGDGLREIELVRGMGRPLFWQSDEPERESLGIDPIKPGSRLRVWTDLRDTNGNSRAHEMKVTLFTDRIEYEWAGEKQSTDSPRIIVLLES